MKKLKIAANTQTLGCFETERDIVDVHHSDFNDVAAIVLSVDDVTHGMVARIEEHGLNIPLFVAVCCEEELDNAVLPALHGVFELCGKNTQFYGKQLEAAAAKYESELLPPFFNTLTQYVEMGNATFACPGHQAASSSVNIRRAASSSTSTAKRFSAPICATPTSNWATC